MTYHVERQTIKVNVYAVVDTTGKIHVNSLGAFDIYDDAASARGKRDALNAQEEQETQ